MMSAAQLEWYRRMTPRERMRLALELTNAGWATVRRQGRGHEVRCIEAINRQHRESVDAILEALERPDPTHGSPSGS